MQTAELIRIQVLMTPPQVALIDALRRETDGLPSRSTVIRTAIEEQAKRVLGDAPATQSHNGRRQRGQNKGK